MWNGGDFNVELWKLSNDCRGLQKAGATKKNNEWRETNTLTPKRRGTAEWANALTVVLSTLGEQTGFTTTKGGKKVTVWD